tara:strand:+ start:572 stop:823 length:252 start_codon:yes stop_codon:yes gene_type:complete
MSEQETEKSNEALFKIGDVVVLKSGGPDMTVSQVFEKGTRYDNTDHHRYCVNWFDQKGNPISDAFLEPMLKSSSETKPTGFMA